jgi:hypothetical protein
MLDSSRFEQTVVLFTRDTATSFAGVSITVGANSVKWTLNLTSSSSSSSSSGEASTGQTEWSVVRYRLSSSGLLASASGNDSSSDTTYSTPAKPIVRINTPTANQTTFFLPLFATAAKSSSGSTTSRDQVMMASVVLFDVALVDGETITPIRHSIVPVASAAANDTQQHVNEYEVVLELPPFNTSLLYDPSVSLGLLVGSDKDGSGGGSGSDNLAVVIGVAVAVPVAVVIVVLIVAVSAVVVWRKRQRMRRGFSGSVNFSSHDQL